MVTTRSGKNPNFIFNNNKKVKSCNKVSIANFQIYEDDIKVGTKRNESLNAELSPIKKCIREYTNDQSINKENNTNISNQIKSKESSFQSSEFKKIIITEDEKLMNGAPEGDLFDMIVSEDRDLHPFSNIEETKAEFLRICTLQEKEMTWADSYEKVVIIRRIALYHANDLFTYDLVAISQALTFVIESVTALRSCMIRNGILCLKAIINNCATSLSENYENCFSVLSVLLLKTGGGPRFIVELSYDTLSIAAAVISSSMLAQCMIPFIKHRNADIASNAVSIAVTSIRKHALQIELIEDKGHLGNILQILSSGIHSKRPKAKESAKNELKRLHDSYIASSSTIATFQEFLATYLNDSSLVNEILRAITSSSTATTPSSAVTLRTALVNKDGICSKSPFVIIPSTSSIQKQRSMVIMAPHSKYIHSNTIDTKQPSNCYNRSENSSTLCNSSSSSNLVVSTSNSIPIDIVVSTPLLAAKVLSESLFKHSPELIHEPQNHTVEATIAVNENHLTTSHQHLVNNSSRNSNAATISIREHILLMKQKHKQQSTGATVEASVLTIQDNNRSNNDNSSSMP